ncbi:MAG: DUF6787 family protein [Chitinophagales bacterium]|jgi:hypothetical protein
MLDKLKTKWGVNNLNLFLILCTFALGGSLCGFLGRKVLGLIGLGKGEILYWPSYIFAMTLLWPLCVISVSIVTGQFKFFKNYLKKIFRRIV